MRQVRIPASAVRLSRVTPPSGGKTYTRDDYSSHGQYLSRKVEQTSKSIDRKSDRDLVDEVVYSIRSAKDSKIKESRHKLKSIGVDVIKIDPRDSTVGIAASTRSDFKILQKKIETYANSESHVGKSYFAAIESFEEVDPISKIDAELLEEGFHNCILYLYSRFSDDEQLRVLQNIIRLIDDVNTSDEQLTQQRVGSKFLKTSSSGLALNAILPREQIIYIATAYNSVRLIKANSTLRIQPATVGDPVSPMVSVAPVKHDVTVGVLDSGIATGSRLLRPFLNGRYEDLGLGVTFDTDHGTLVASRIIYGGDIEQQVASGSLNPVCMVHDIPIFYKDATGRDRALTEADVIDILNNFVLRYPEVKIFNLSFGTKKPIIDFSISALASELDSLCKKYDKLFVIASGNMHHSEPHDWATFPAYVGDAAQRITAPAESLLSIAVGSYAHAQSMNDVSLPMQLSAFSRSGPGMDGGIKPDLVSVGGNCYVRRGAADFRSESATAGLDGAGTSIAYNVGTSFSAPLVTHNCAQLLGDNPGASANLLKCYLLHFSSNVGLNGAVAHRPDNNYGFGEFQAADYFGNHTNRLLFAYEGGITASEYVHIPFHIPRAFDTQTSKRMKIKFTVIHNPEVDSENPAEYSLSDILFEISKNFNGSKRKVGGTNASLSKYSSKWNPVIKYERVFDREFSSGEWEIRLRLNTRGALDENYKQDFAILIECIDETNTIDVYTRLLSDFGSHYSFPVSKPGSAV